MLVESNNYLISKHVTDGDGCQAPTHKPAGVLNTDYHVEIQEAGSP